MNQSVRPYGVTAEFTTPEELLGAVRAVRGNGYTRVDALTPFPVHGLDQALGLGRSRLGYLLVIGGKPLFAFEFSIPITFELTVLFASFAAVVSMLVWNGLPRLYHPVFRSESYRRATNDAFVLVIEGDDPKFDAEGCTRLLESLGARRTEVVEEETA